MQESCKVSGAAQETKFKIGQTVWCLLYGKGKVVDITYEGGENPCPVEVEFETTEKYCVSYTLDGKCYSDANRTLFYSEPQVIAATEPVFEPKLVGKVVLVKNVGGEEVGFGYVEDEFDTFIMVDDYKYPKSMYNFYEFKDQPVTFD